jgi:Winged helix-turn-helix DNA-binding
VLGEFVGFLVGQSGNRVVVKEFAQRVEASFEYHGATISRMSDNYRRRQPRVMSEEMLLATVVKYTRAGMKQAEIAKRTGLSQSGVSRALRRAIAGGAQRDWLPGDTGGGLKLADERW